MMDLTRLVQQITAWREKYPHAGEFDEPFLRFLDSMAAAEAAIRRFKRAEERYRFFNINLLLEEIRQQRT